MSIENKQLSSNYEMNITDSDKYYFHEGKHIYAYKFMGAHLSNENGIQGVRFTT